MLTIKLLLGAIFVVLCGISWGVSKIGERIYRVTDYQLEKYRRDAEEQQRKERQLSAAMWGVKAEDIERVERELGGEHAGAKSG